ncbi:hypothetical protein ILYODFUR_038553 [Ilyodon furcidens]|uniref:Ig-like domain-containing protein n=1 Tax=Ilyodon furcidens TaxID=33524 RepID=A0ABV0UZM4_9TELE
MKILAGEKVEILCKFSGAPPITCTWLKFRKPIQEDSSDISIESTDSSSKLTISSGQQEHCGCYTIELRNSYGLRQAALNLTIVGKKHLLHLDPLRGGNIYSLVLSSNV